VKKNTKDPNATDVHWVARTTAGSSDYVGLPDFPGMSAGSMRLASQNGRPIFATEAVLREEVIQAALAHIKKLPTMTLRGDKTYNKLFYDSEVYHAFDPSRPILVDKQKVAIFDSKPPTTETTLQRPLRGFLQIPSALWRPYDLHWTPSANGHMDAWSKCSTSPSRSGGKPEGVISRA